MFWVVVGEFGITFAGRISDDGTRDLLLELSMVRARNSAHPKTSKNPKSSPERKTPIAPRPVLAGARVEKLVAVVAKCARRDLQWLILPALPDALLPEISLAILCCRILA